MKKSNLRKSIRGQIKKLKEGFNVKVCVTAQHREMLDQVLNFFNVTPDFDLDVMGSDQELSETSAKIFLGLKKILTKEKPNLVLVHQYYYKHDYLFLFVTGEVPALLHL